MVPGICSGDCRNLELELQCDWCHACFVKKVRSMSSFSSFFSPRIISLESVDYFGTSE